MAKQKEKFAKMSGEDLQRLFDSEYGVGTVQQLNSNKVLAIPSIPMDSLSLTEAMGVFPRGRIIEVYGPESGGKTTFALYLAKQVQQAGMDVAFIDAEHALDPLYAQKLGVKTDGMWIVQPDYGEQALTITQTFVEKASNLGLVIVDSVSALTPQAEIDGEMGASHMGLQARLMSQAMRKLVASCKQAGVTIVFINQMRMKIGVMFGNPEVTTGGKALKFYASQRIDIRRGEELKAKEEGEEVIYGIECRFKLAKNKVFPPKKTCILNLIFNEGYDLTTELIDYGIKFGIVKRSGSWYSYNDTKLGQGREKAKEMLNSTPDIKKEIYDKVWAAHRERVSVKRVPVDDLPE